MHGWIPHNWVTVWAQRPQAMASTPSGTDPFATLRPSQLALLRLVCWVACADGDFAEEERQFLAKLTGRLLAASTAEAVDQAVAALALEGEADVLLNDRGIARVTTGEMFGTVAALTQSHRNATVRAKTDCSVLQVPTEHFSELIRSHPAAVERLLVDMAKSITQLNEEVVALRHRQQSR